MKIETKYELWKKDAYVIWTAACKCIDSIIDEYFKNKILWKIRKYFSVIKIEWVIWEWQAVRNYWKLIWTFKVWEDSYISYFN